MKTILKAPSLLVTLTVAFSAFAQFDNHAAKAGVVSSGTRAIRYLKEKSKMITTRISMRSFNKVVFILLSIILASSSHAWETTSRSTPQGQVYVAWKVSSTDPGVSLVVGCIRGQSNATVSIDTANFLVGQPNTGMGLIYFAVGQGEYRVGSGSISQAQGRVREDGKGFYFGEGQQGISITSIIGRNDWLKVFWDFAAPSRSRIMRNIIGDPARKPQKEYLFNTSGFASATRDMAGACSW